MSAARHSAATHTALWRQRLEALTHWCLGEQPLADAVAAALPGGRPTLGDLLRRALAHDRAGVVDLLDALDALEAPDAPGAARAAPQLLGASAGAAMLGEAGPAPTARALVARVLGGDLLLVVLTAGGGAIVRADVQACRTTAEARALVEAFLGRPAPRWGPTYGVVESNGQLGVALGASIAPVDDSSAPSPSQTFAGATITVVLPFLPIHGGVVDGDGAGSDAPHAPDDAATLGPPAGTTPAILGGTLAAGGAFLEAPGWPAVGALAGPPGAAAGPDDVDGDDDDEHPERAPGDEDEPDDDGTADGTADGDPDADLGGDDAPAAADADDAEADDAADAGARPSVAGDRATGDAERERGWTRDERPRRTWWDAPPPASSGPPPEPVIEPAERALALERLRARAAAPVDRVSVLIATDDGSAEHVADAARWLAQASDTELEALAGSGWAGAAALDLADAVADDDPEAREVVQLARRLELELVVEIDAAAAGAWLARHRPEVAERLDGDA